MAVLIPVTNAPSLDNAVPCGVGLRPTRIRSLPGFKKMTSGLSTIIHMHICIHMHIYTSTVPAQQHGISQVDK